MTINSARTDGDSWGPGTSVGATATMVAAGRALASKGPDALLHDPLADPLVRAVGLDPFIRMIDGEVTFEDDALLRREALNEQIAVRTRFFDDFFTRATNAGIRQAVILASGLDTRAYRLGWPEGMVVYEIDQPQVIDFKTRTLADLDVDPTANRRPIGIDLRNDWPNALRQHGFDVNQRPAGLPAARSSGPAVRQHHHAQCAGQPRRHRALPRPRRILWRTCATALRALEPPRVRPQHVGPDLSRRAQHRDPVPYRPRLGCNRAVGQGTVRAQRLQISRGRDYGVVG